MGFATTESAIREFQLHNIILPFHCHISLWRACYYRKALFKAEELAGSAAETKVVV